MPKHDWICETCGGEVRDRYERAEEQTVPECPNAPGSPLTEHRMVILWSTGQRYVPFKKFTYETFDGREVPIESMHQLRELEKTGDGGRPVVFRAFSQDRSNMDRNTLGKPPDQRGFQTRSRRGVPFVTSRVERFEGEEEED